MSEIALTLDRGADAAFIVTILGEDGKPVDLTGCALTFTAKLQMTDPESKAIITHLLTANPDQTAHKGQATLTFLAIDTAFLNAPSQLFYDVRLLDADNLTSFPFRGTLALNPTAYTASGNANPGTYSYDPNADIGRVRLLIDDRDLSSVDASTPLEQRSAIFNDAEIQAFIDMGQGNPLFGIPTAQQSVPGMGYLYGAANALTAIAGNRQLLVQSRRIGRAQVEFGSVRQDLLKQATQILDIATNLPADGYAEQILTDFNLRRVIVNTQLRTAP